jgi:hypothetical protein
MLNKQWKTKCLQIILQFRVCVCVCVSSRSLHCILSIGMQTTVREVEAASEETESNQWRFSAVFNTGFYTHTHTHTHTHTKTSTHTHIFSYTASKKYRDV